MKAFLFIILCSLLLSACTPGEYVGLEAVANADGRNELAASSFLPDLSELAQANNSSEKPSISTNGQYITYVSRASNLIANDTNFNCGLSSTDNCADIFLFNRSTNVISLVSKSSAGVLGNNWSDSPAISGDGRFIAFISAASNLVPGDTNNVSDVFLHDLQTAQTTRISVSSSSAQSNGSSNFTAISNNGRYIAFVSSANNLVPNDTNGVQDVFVHDTVTGATTRVSVSSSGQEANGGSLQPAISADGRFVAFASAASNLVGGDTNNLDDVFVHDRQTNATGRISVASNGAQGNNVSWAPDISADGRYVVFGSEASNLTASDTNQWGDIFLRDRQTNTTTLISKTSEPANSWSQFPVISSDGNLIVFFSWASNLAENDENDWPDIFLYQKPTNTTSLVSVAGNGVQQMIGVTGMVADISGNGNFIVFTTPVSNLVPNDTNGEMDVFVLNRQTNSIQRVSGN